MMNPVLIDLTNRGVMTCSFNYFLMTFLKVTFS